MNGKCMTIFQPFDAKLLKLQLKAAFEQSLYHRLTDACKGPIKKPMKPPRPARRGR